jgi:hypothetical protein
MKKIVSLAAALALVAGTVNAQTTAAHNVSIVLGDKLKLTFTPGTVSAPSDAEFDAGTQTVSGAATATVSANRTWNLQVSSTGWGAVGSYTKATGDLEIQANGGGFSALTGSAADLFGSAQAKGKDLAQTLDYRLAWDYANDEPGTYAITIDYTLIAQ